MQRIIPIDSWHCQINWRLDWAEDICVLLRRNEFQRKKLLLEAMKLYPFGLRFYLSSTGNIIWRFVFPRSKNEKGGQFCFPWFSMFPMAKSRETWKLDRVDENLRTIIPKRIYLVESRFLEPSISRHNSRYDESVKHCNLVTIRSKYLLFLWWFEKSGFHCIQRHFMHKHLLPKFVVSF